MINFLPIILLIVVSLVLRAIYKSWFAPGAFFTMSWCFFILVPMIFASEFTVYLFGLWVITAMVIAFAVGSILAFNEELILVYKSPQNSNELSRSRPLIYYSTIIMTCLACLGVILLLRFSISKFQLDYSFFSIFLLPSSITAERFNQILIYPFYLKFFLYFLFPASLIAGFGFTFAKRKAHIILFLSPLFVAVFKGTLETTRSTILLSVILWLAGFLGGRVISRDNLQRFMERKMFIFTSLAGVLFLGLFIGLQWLRDAGGDLYFSFIIERVKLYFFGYLSAFTIWMENLQNVDVSLGMTTLAGPFNILGLIDRELGFYSHTLVHKATYTNIYTALRGLIHDFSIIGSLIVCAVAGYVSTIAYFKSLQGSILWLLPLTLFYGFTLYSPLISVFHYNSVIMAWLIVFSIFFFKPRKSNPINE